MAYLKSVGVAPVVLVCTLAGAVLLGAAPLGAATLGVPIPYATIQTAIDAAVSGDVVVVEAGTYHERLRLYGKAITVRSTDPSDSAVVATTVIDGDAGGSVVSFIDDEPSACALRGFTITNGAATLGGGIYCTGSPTIANNDISGNTAGDGGGGVYCSASAAVISGNSIRSNETGIFGLGGGLSVVDGSVTVTGNAIESNSAFGGGGLYCSEGTPQIVGNRFQGNSADRGGGVLTDLCPADVRSNIMFLNSASAGGGGMRCLGGAPTLDGNTIVCNSSPAGGGLLRSGAEAMVVVNCIIAFSYSGGGVACSATATVPTVSYCDVYGNTDGNYVGMVDPTGSDGNLSEDPLMAGAQDGDCHLLSYYGRWEPLSDSWAVDSQHSPCIDAGSPASSYLNEPYPNGGRRNIGAYGNTTEASKSLNHDPTTPTAVTISPAQPKTADDLVATPSGATDPDNDGVIYQVQWACLPVGGSWGAWQEGSATLSDDATTKGEQWKARARALDVPGTGYPVTARHKGARSKNVSEWVESDPVTIGDTAPTAPTAVEVRFPGSAGGSSLQGYATGSTDADGDTIRYVFVWSRETPKFPDEQWGYPGTVLSVTTVKGERWKCRARARTDGLVSEWVQSDYLTVVDTSPTVPTSLVITPATVTGRRDLCATASGSTDAEGDSIRYVYQWASSDDQGQTWSNWEHSSRRLPAAVLGPGQQWKARCRALAGTPTLRSEWLESSVVTVSGAAGAPALALNAAATATRAGGAQVALNLSAAATVQVRVLNLAGRPIAALPERSLAAGATTLLWNGRSSLGTLAPGGSYLVSVQAWQGGGAQAQVLVPLAR